jgi:tetratricopeptide (TPR) repeat protein
VPALWGRVGALDTELDLDTTGNRDRIVQEMDDLTSRAVKLDPDDPDAWDARSSVLMYSGRWDAALEANARAMALDPNASWLLRSRAWLMNMSGKPGEALVFVDRAFAMDPRDAGGQMRMACEAHLLLGQYEQTIATCEKAAGLIDDWIVHLFLIAAYANRGDMAKADAEKAEVLRRAPGYTIATLKSKRYSVNPEYMQLAEAHWYAGLRKAGIPEN